jgi:hypothetical protein
METAKTASHFTSRNIAHYKVAGNHERRWRHHHNAAKEGKPSSFPFTHTYPHRKEESTVAQFPAQPGEGTDVIT